MTHRTHWRTHLRHILAPFAVAAMLLGLAGNAGAQLAFPSGSGIGTFPGFALTLTYPPGVAITPTTFPAATGATLTYTWSPAATGDLFSPTTGASVTWTPPTVTAATLVTLTVTVSDGATTPLTLV